MVYTLCVTGKYLVIPGSRIKGHKSGIQDMGWNHIVVTRFGEDTTHVILNEPGISFMNSELVFISLSA